jgi:Protein of unknown function (DUF3131)
LANAEPSLGRRRCIAAALAHAAWPTSAIAHLLPDRFEPYAGETIDGEIPVFSRGMIPAAPEETEGQPAPPTTASHTAGMTPDPASAAIAKRAWLFFQAVQSPTGLFDSVFGYHYATMWDVASGIAGLVCAQRLGLIGRAALIAELQRMLASLSKMPLYQGELPNREYNIATLAMQGLSSKPSARGSGWSATDMGRLLIWLKIASNWYLELEKPIRDLVGQWALHRIVKGGEAYGGYLDRDRAAVRQEGRLGYEQYAATGLALWGLDPHKALQCGSTEKFELLGVPLLRDTRNLASLTSEPFVMARMEIGHLNAEFDKLEHGIFEVQKKFSGVKGTLIAVSEDSVDREPWFLYNSVCFERKPWACVSPAGKPYPHLANVSAKTAMAWWAMYDDDYALRVFDAVEGAFHPQRGYYAGVFHTGVRNESLNINTNAVILEAMLYRQLGRQSFLKGSSSISL